MRRAARFWMAGALPVAALAVYGLAYDSRMLFVAAAMIFILFPTLLFIGWYNILTRPWAVASLLPQRVTIEPDNEIIVEYQPMPRQQSKDAEGQNRRKTAKPADLLIPPGDISGCHLHGDYIVITYSDSRELMIPLSAMPSPEASSEILNRLSPAR